MPGSDALAGARAGGPARSSAAALSDADDARLVFGTVYSLRNMVRKLGGEEDSFVSFRTGEYKLHYYETPTSLKFVMLTDTRYVIVGVCCVPGPSSACVAMRPLSRDLGPGNADHTFRMRLLIY